MRRGSSLIQDLALIVILVGAAYFLFPSWFSWLPMGENTIGGSLTINYEDGTSRVVTSNPFISQVIEDTSGKYIASIVATTTVTPAYTGVPTSMRVTGNAVWYVDLVSKQTTPISYTTTILSGGTATVATETITKATIEGWNAALGTHILKVETPVRFTATYISPEPESFKDGTFSATITYNKLNYGVTAVSVFVSTTMH